METPVTHRGGCLCGGVRYEVSGALRGVVACHCSQCRRTSGHFVAATSAANDALHLVEQQTLVWYRSSDQAERGFCGRCGGNLFWRQTGAASTSIMAGTLDPPTGIAIEQHIFVADKSDYYTLDDDRPKWPRWDR
jgi:hypothetical protein